MSIVKVLPDYLANQIAAGEVIERPASVVKELVENSIDAGAENIVVNVENSGVDKITVSDDGSGIYKEDLLTCLQRHATSKISETEDLFNIHSLGFRGEALPSIASVSRFEIASKHKDAELAWQVTTEGAKDFEIKPASHKVGTSIQVRDLFFNTPARRKFLKSGRAEQSAIYEVVSKIAIAHPETGFKLVLDSKEKINFKGINEENIAEAYKSRLGQLLGNDFVRNSVAVESMYDKIQVHGYTSLPTYNVGLNNKTYIYVNGRPVKDKLILASIKQAYHDRIPKNRYPICVLFIDLPSREIDVNVHPAKAEIRFKSSRDIFSVINKSISKALESKSRESTEKSKQEAINYFKPVINDNQYSKVNIDKNVVRENISLFNRPEFNVQEKSAFSIDLPPEVRTPDTVGVEESIENNIKYPLGAAVGQLHNTYIISQSEDGIILLDQHAAHERIVYEKLKKDILEKQVEIQRLLIPEIIEMNEFDLEVLVKHEEELTKFGLEIEQFGETAVAVRGTPALLGNVSVKSLVLDLVEELKSFSKATSLKSQIEKVLATVACHASIRSGRIMKIEEMNSLLREVETTNNTAQCNHGRPTYVKLSKKDLDKLFDR